MSGLAGITDHLTNYDTGESYRGLYMKVKGNEVEFGTTTDKETDISNRMNKKAFGLTPENKIDFIKQFALPIFIKKVRQKLKL